MTAGREYLLPPSWFRPPPEFMPLEKALISSRRAGSVLPSYGQPGVGKASPGETGGLVDS